ncbi:hypothetical protein EG832_19860 [bacterium]|nr:hypothetical protein [bacterium]
MSIRRTSEASLDLSTLQSRINNIESKVVVRLENLEGMTEEGLDFNIHDYKLINDKSLPFSRLFLIPAGGTACDDPNVAAWLLQNKGHKIICEKPAYISGSLNQIAVVGTTR